MDPETPEQGVQPPATPGPRTRVSPRISVPGTTPAQVSQRMATVGQVPPPPGQPRGNLQASRPNVLETPRPAPPQPKMGRRMMMYDGSYVLYCGGEPKHDWSELTDSSKMAPTRATQSRSLSVSDERKASEYQF